MAAARPTTASALRYINQAQAQRIDEELMSTYAFSIDQLMELAGLSVAAVVEHEFQQARETPVLVVAGPGNNGGDALVAARHLKHFGFAPEILYPKTPKNPLYKRLVQQCQDLDIPFLQDLSKETIDARYGCVLDGIFGFSFQGEIRAPFDDVIKTLRSTTKPIVSIDIPSGWDVEKGNVSGCGLTPSVLISLTAPKLCAQLLSPSTTTHYVGGRFVPRVLAEKYLLAMPKYVGAQQFARWEP
ncbi:YjeF [Saprolegnia diclina VS20]|uniref:NAD(P)H-hydrate epimerase n=1 Tax=Saprolegnia diclina (strain VS20) TaxID=1156394 RepID=T0PJ77_SAPDV|nr:YjeF [Saprolegnia diclina VS20]EQC25429.1 YjeF [Saprolegnia diclina VS20]|eukprot:XP_008621135.1 YjeF [Saprolegnia diclina VS20]